VEIGGSCKVFGIFFGNMGEFAICDIGLRGMDAPENVIRSELI